MGLKGVKKLSRRSSAQGEKQGGGVLAGKKECEDGIRVLPLCAVRKHFIF